VSAIAASAALLPAETKIRVMLHLLKFRDWLSGVRFPKGTTVSGWLEEQFRYLPKLALEEQSEFIATVQKMAYAPAKKWTPQTIHDPFPTRLFWSIITQGITDLFRVESVFRKRKKSPLSTKVTLSQS
jgi:hypothetical protein